MKAKDEAMINFNCDMETGSSNKSLNRNIDENNPPKSPSILFPKRYLKKRQKSRITFYPIKNNENATVTENSTTTLMNNTSKISKDVIEVSHTQKSVTSKVKQLPEKKILDKCNVWSKRKDISKQLNMRCKADRAKLNGWECWECREYYKTLSLSKEEIQKRTNQHSRHRRKYKRPDTPEGFWDPLFLDTLSTTE